MTIEKDVALGIEICGGGSGDRQTVVALVDHTGEVQLRRQVKTLRGRPAIATLEPALRSIDEALLYAQRHEWSVRGIGVCIPGSVDPAQRRPTLVPLLPALNQFPLGDLLESRYQLPTSVYADVDATLLGEQQLGVGKEYQRLLLLTMNMVVGASLCVDGRLEGAQDRAIGHVCHVPIGNNGTRCSCGRYGCINTLLSWDAVQRTVQRALRRGKESSLLQRLSNHEMLSHQILAEEAVRGDGVALQIYGEVVRCLKISIELYVRQFDPHIFILGGGMAYASEFIVSQLRPFLDLLRPPWYPRIEVAPTCLGGDGALIGAAISSLVLVKPGQC